MESTLVTLMLVDKQPHPEARAIIERNRENWARLLPAGSRTLAEADVLAAVADIKGAFHGARAGRPIDEPTLRRAERVLLDSLPMFEGWYRDSELHVLAVRALRSLYGQHLLRDAVEYERFREIYLRHTGKSRSESADPQPDWNRYEEWRELRRDGANDGTDEAGSAVH